MSPITSVTRSRTIIFLVALFTIVVHPYNAIGQASTYSREEGIRFHQLNLAWSAAGTYQSKAYYRAVIDTMDQFLKRYPNSVYATGVYSYKLDLVSSVSSDAVTIGAIADSLLLRDAMAQTTLGVAEIFIRKNVNAARGADLINEILPQLTVASQRYLSFTLLAAYDMAHGDLVSAREDLRLAILADSTRYEAWYSALALAKAQEHVDESRAIEARIAALDKKELLKFSADASKSVNLFKDLSPYRFTDLHGRAVTLSSYNNRIVVLDLFAFWCGACFPELPKSFSRLEKEFPGVSFLYVNASGKDIAGTSAVVKQQLLHQPKFSFLKKQTLLFPVNNLDDSLSIKAVPTTLILDKHGIVRFEYLGYTKGSEAIVRSNLQTLLHE